MINTADTFWMNWYQNVDHICSLLSFIEYVPLSSTLVQDISICRTVTPSAAMGIIAPRDFVDVILIKQYEDGSISSNGA